MLVLSGWTWRKTVYQDSLEVVKDARRLFERQKYAEVRRKARRILHVNLIIWRLKVRILLSGRTLRCNIFSCYCPPTHTLTFSGPNPRVTMVGKNKNQS